MADEYDDLATELEAAETQLQETLEALTNLSECHKGKSIKVVIEDIEDIALELQKFLEHEGKR